MLRNASHMVGFTTRASDGEIGKVTEFYFDDVSWAVRYMIVNTGNWLAQRLVLISPISIEKVDWTSRQIDVGLTMKQVEDSPNIDTRKTVSRLHEEEYMLYYGYPNYWDGPHMWGYAQQPWGLLSPVVGSGLPALKPEEAHLRGSKEITGYHIEGADGQIGHAEDFIIDDETWAIRYLVVNTSNWWLGRKVLVAPQWIDRVSWEDAKIHVGLSYLTIKHGPAYDDAVPITREYENRLHDYYHRSAYWLSKVS